MLRTDSTIFYRYHLRSARKWIASSSAIGLVARRRRRCSLSSIWLTDIRHIAIGYVIPVLIAAIRWGVVEAVVAALDRYRSLRRSFSMSRSSIFRFNDTLQIIDLILFLLVAIGHRPFRNTPACRSRARQPPRTGERCPLCLRPTIDRGQGRLRTSTTRSSSILLCWSGAACCCWDQGQQKRQQSSCCAHAPARGARNAARRAEPHYRSGARHPGG